MSTKPFVSCSYLRGLGKPWAEIHKIQPRITFILMDQPQKPTLPRPRALMHDQVTETNGSFRPVVEATFQRRFLWFTWSEEFSFYGGSWVARMAARKAVKR